MFQNLLIIGKGEALDYAETLANASKDHAKIVILNMVSEDGFNFLLPDLRQYSPENWTAFVALDERGLNLSRALLVSQMKGAGYTLHKLIAESAEISSNVRIGENTIIGANCVVGRNSRIGYNVVVMPLSSIGSDAVVGNSCYLGRLSSIGVGSKIGDLVTIGANVHLREHSAVGKYSELRQLRDYEKMIPQKTFYVDPFPNPVSIISPL